MQKKIEQIVKILNEKGYKAKYEKVAKNNNVVHHGIVILGNNNVNPVFYLDKIIKKDAVEIAEGIIKFYNNNSYVNVNFNIDFSKPENIIAQIVNKEKNKELLKNCPYTDFLDLAIIYRYKIDQSSDGSIMSARITNDILAKMDMTKEELHQAAMKNMETPTVKNIMSVLPDFWIESCDFIPIKEIPMYIISNKTGLYGAVAVCDTNILAISAEKLNNDLYLFPSSVHEFLCVPAISDSDPEYLKAMIRQINITEVKEEEVLSDNLYFYDKKTKEVKIV